MAARLPVPGLIVLSALAIIASAPVARAVDGVAGSVREAAPAPVRSDAAKPVTANGLVKSITIRAPRDMGYFQGDLVKAEIDIVLADGAAIETPSLPHPGPIAYWLDLRGMDVTSQAAGADRLVKLKLVYQDFYDALDARPQEIPTFPVTVRRGDQTATADVPAWTIGVSPLREVAPPVKDDPKDYLRADQIAPFVKTDTAWTAAAVVALATVLAVLLLAFDRAWWPFRPRPSRIFGAVERRLRRLPDGEASYIEALLALHRGIDMTHGRRVMADDLPAFLARHGAFSPSSEAFSTFFLASRQAFFGSDPSKAREILKLDAVKAFAKRLAAIERAS